MHRADSYSQQGSFESLHLPGFINAGLPGQLSCDSLRYSGTIEVQKSIFLEDDVHQIASTLESHPMVVYPEHLAQDPTITAEDLIDKTWARLSGSSIWLPEQHVFLAVSRVIFTSSGNHQWPVIGFLRGQLFNEMWEPLENHTIHWQDKAMTFPLIFDVHTEYKAGDGFFGPEDPRIILEDGVEGAEPVIVYNMIEAQADWKRAMHIYRPFSNQSTILTIRHEERSIAEKNWAPFFVPPDDTNEPRKANEYIHFVKEFRPLRILRCHLRCGDCDVVFEQTVPEGFKGHHHEEGGNLRGGTNFIPIPLPQTRRARTPSLPIHAWAGFPRTMNEVGCGDRIYRPEFAVMMLAGTDFYLAFASEPLGFGTAIVELMPGDDGCEKGRFLIPNSIARWEAPDDTMSVTFSVDDSTVQVTRIRGLLEFVRHMPPIQEMQRAKASKSIDEEKLSSMAASWVGDDVRACLLESALNLTQSIESQWGHSKDEKKEEDKSTDLVNQEPQDRPSEQEVESAESDRDDETSNVDATSLRHIHQHAGLRSGSN